MSAALSTTRAERSALDAADSPAPRAERSLLTASDRRAEAGRLVVVSNRLPIIVETENGASRVRPSSGGLVTALTPVLRRASGVWIGWPGGSSLGAEELSRLMHDYGAATGFELQPVNVSREELEGFYQGYANEIIWPLFHDLQSLCNFVPDYWTQYVSVKRKFAEAVQSTARPEDLLWIQDYHLMGLGRQLRELGLPNRMGFFLHIPFPPPDIFCKLPWRSDVLEGLLHYDVIGFQTPRDRDNYIDCVRKLMPDVRFRRREATVETVYAGRRARIGVFPISIDYAHYAAVAASPAVTEHAAALRREFASSQIVLSVDRLDYTKGIPYRLRAFQLALQRYPELHRAVTLVQVVVPSRENVPQYQELRAQIERLVTQINGEFAQPGWVPIHHVFRSLEWEELLAYYRAADAALITPLKDGMNLVAKEYCACQVEGNGVLILSEFAGAAVQFRKDAFLVNPFDLSHLAETIRHAVTTTPEQRRPRMRRLKSLVRREDVFWWVDRMLEACGAPAALRERVAPRRRTSRTTHPDDSGARG